MRVVTTTPAFYYLKNGLVNYHMDMEKLQEQHNYNTRNKDKLRLPKVARSWRKQRII